MPHPTQTTHITAVREPSPGVRELILAPPAERVEFLPGQWLSLHLPVGDHPPLVRAYSLATAPVAAGELSLCFDLVPDGLGSEYLFTLQPGDPITFAGPLGNFVLPSTDAELLWIARYTGIVPFRGMLQQLAAQAPAGRMPVTLLYSAARREDLAFREALEQAAAELPWFELRLLIDTESAVVPETAPAAVLDQLPNLLAGRSEVIPMVCGKREFVRPIRDYFYGLGYDRKAVKWENYD